MPTSAGNIFTTGLGPTAANAAALTPIAFLPRAAAVYPDRAAIVYGDRRITYRELDTRTRRLASALAARGIGEGDTVAVMLPNIPAMLDVHFGVPMLGAVLNAINTRLDPRTIAYILGHGEAKVLITDRAFSATVGAALAQLDRKPLVIDVVDPLYQGPGERLGEIEYEAFLEQGDPGFAWSPPARSGAGRRVCRRARRSPTENPSHWRGTSAASTGRRRQAASPTPGSLRPP